MSLGGILLCITGTFSSMHKKVEIIFSITKSEDIIDLILHEDVYIWFGVAYGSPPKRTT